jgi:hypothetical protein
VVGWGPAEEHFAHVEDDGLIALCHGGWWERGLVVTEVEKKGVGSCGRYAHYVDDMESCPMASGED